MLRRVLRLAGACEAHGPAAQRGAASAGEATRTDGDRAAGLRGFGGAGVCQGRTQQERYPQGRAQQAAAGQSSPDTPPEVRVRGACVCAARHGCTARASARRGAWRGCAGGAVSRPPGWLTAPLCGAAVRRDTLARGCTLACKRRVDANTRRATNSSMQHVCASRVFTIHIYAHTCAVHIHSPYAYTRHMHAYV